MTTTDTTVNNLIINTMTQAQYSQITPSDTELYLVTDSTITSSEVTTALGYTPTSPANVDGQWVQKSQSLNSSTSAGTWTYNLGSTGNNPINYLPDNNYYYEVLIVAFGNSDSSAQMIVSSDVMTSLDEDNRASIWSAANGRNHTQIYSLPVGPGGFIKQRNTAKFSSSASLLLYGYRRIGTNT